MTLHIDDNTNTNRIIIIDNELFAIFMWVAMPSVLLSSWTSRCFKVQINTLQNGSAILPSSHNQSASMYNYNFFFPLPACWNHLKVLNIKTSHFIFSRVYSIYRYLFHSCLPLTQLFHLNWCLYRIRIVSVRWFLREQSNTRTPTIIAFRVCGGRARTFIWGITNTQRVGIQCKFKASHYLSCQMFGFFKTIWINKWIAVYFLSRTHSNLVWFIFLFKLLKLAFEFHSKWKQHVNETWKWPRKLKLYSMLKLNCFLFKCMCIRVCVNVYFFSLLFFRFVFHSTVFHLLLLLLLLLFCQPNECHLLLCTFTALHFAHLI